ncbi:hypothetical protein [Streptomyces parvus]|uniref:hypothetical protein n=1 Tax=Streptomyces parvus TaxID=66428 RepID=UPI0021017662|nr:hypothetical protein [Streptomyces parvus]MCQ1580394.1 hypothetical protein [Streptomyces parvus]
MGNDHPPDHALTAIREALAAVHDLSLVHVRRTTDPDSYITVMHHPNPAAQPDQLSKHPAYAATLQEAGWEQALSLGPLVLIPNIPPADTAPDTHIATWSATIDDVPDPVDAAYEARHLQHEGDLTEAVWTITDATGRCHLIITDDNPENVPEPEPEHAGRVEFHTFAHDHPNHADTTA